MSIVTTPGGHRLGYKLSHRFHALRATLAPVKEVSLPPSVDLTQWFPGISNQGTEGACTGFSEAEFCATWTNKRAATPIGKRAAAYIYAKTRQAEGTFPQDAGSTLLDGFSVMQADGVCSEDLLPYRGDPSEAPTPDCDKDAANYRVPNPSMVACDEVSIKRVLAMGSPVSITIPVYPAFEQTGPDGQVMLPDPSQQLLGYHAIIVLGYSDSWLIANSWGPSWGHEGFGHLAYGWEGHFIEAMTAL